MCSKPNFNHFPCQTLHVQMSRASNPSQIWYPITSFTGLTNDGAHLLDPSRAWYGISGWRQRRLRGAGVTGTEAGSTHWSPGPTRVCTFLETCPPAVSPDTQAKDPSRVRGTPYLLIRTVLEHLDGACADEDISAAKKRKDSESWPHLCWTELSALSPAAVMGKPIALHCIHTRDISLRFWPHPMAPGSHQ